MPKKNGDFPWFLNGIVEEATYFRWLERKAIAHFNRDRKRGNTTADRNQYLKAIHEAVKASGGVDAYTGKPLKWTLIGTYRNEESKAGKRAYWKTFQDLPTVDHIDDGMGTPNFKICSQLTNDCKSHLSHEELVQFCRNVIEYHDNLKSGRPS